eukprot:6207571-Pleurochrysis_carterae.AAC.7
MSFYSCKLASTNFCLLPQSYSERVLDVKVEADLTAGVPRVGDISTVSHCSSGATSRGAATARQRAACCKDWSHVQNE